MEETAFDFEVHVNDHNRGKAHSSSPLHTKNALENPITGPGLTRNAHVHVPVCV